MLEFFGYIASILIGITLGLIGSGGSILAVPVLVYMFKINAITATVYSLGIVSFASLVGSLTYLKQGNFNYKIAIGYGIPSLLSLLFVRRIIVPLIPDIIINTDFFSVTKSAFMLLLFALLMMIASYNMIKKEVVYSETNSIKINYALIILFGIIEGLLTGLVGAGGGFLIVPIFVFFAKLSIKEAIGTSLIVISTKSFVGFLSDSAFVQLDWILLLKIIVMATVGIFIGIRLSKKIDGKKLKPAFGWFVLMMGTYILVKELFFK